MAECFHIFPDELFPDFICWLRRATISFRLHYVRLSVLQIICISSIFTLMFLYMYMGGSKYSIVYRYFLLIVHLQS